MNILVDIGNSRFKWAVENLGRIQFKGALDYRESDFFNTLSRAWNEVRSPEKIAISSVSSRQVVEQLQLLIERIWPDAETILPVPMKHGFGITNAYQQPERLGVDRWLTLLAAHRHHSGDVCVVDCGTAITIDFLSGEGQHSGGLICPGLRLMKKALLQGTEELPFSISDFKPGLASATEPAIFSGTLFAASGLIEYVLRQNPAQRLILTGGDSGMIAGYLNYQAVIDMDLVMKGLALYCESDVKS